MRESDNDYLNNKNPTPPQLRVVGVIASTYIICAAIWYQDGKKYMHQPRNVDSGFTVCGRRHHNCFITSYILNGEESLKKKVSTDEWKVTQGFITSDDRFVNRKEASQIAYDSGQTVKLTECLFSEDLY